MRSRDGAPSKVSRVIHLHVQGERETYQAISAPHVSVQYRIRELCSQLAVLGHSPHLTRTQHAWSEALITRGRHTLITIYSRSFHDLRRDTMCGKHAALSELSVASATMYFYHESLRAMKTFPHACLFVASWPLTHTRIPRSAFAVKASCL